MDSPDFGGEDWGKRTSILRCLSAQESCQVFEELLKFPFDKTVINENN